VLARPKRCSLRLDVLAQRVRRSTAQDPDQPPTRSEIESIRRALRNLHRQGLLCTERSAAVAYLTFGKRPRPGRRP
jgi:hypothetical protein